MCSTVMGDISNNTPKLILLNTVKSFTIFSLASIAFVIIITLFPLISSLTMDNFPIQQVIKDNFKLLIPIFIVCLLISPLLGYASNKIRKARFFYLFLIGEVGCWFAIIAVMLMMSNFSIVENEFGSTMLLSAWGLVAYSFFSLPVLIPAIIVLERKTRSNI